MIQMNKTQGSPVAAGEKKQGKILSQVPRKIIQRRIAADEAALGYYLYASSRPRKDLPLFIAVHGIGRRAKDQARLFAPMIEAIGGTLIAPVFDRIRFAGYQRLGISGKGRRPDLALQHLIRQVQESKQRPRMPVVMFGYSGGGQFVHRFAMAYPRQVKRMAVAAPGWFTFPDIDLRFPQGLMRASALPDLTFDASRFLKIPSMVLVGENDVHRDKAVNREKGIDGQQGRHRLERAGQWRKAMKAAARRYRYNTPYPFRIIPGCGHSFKDCMDTGQMGWQIVRFLFGADPMTPFVGLLCRIFGQMSQRWIFIKIKIIFM